ncbi:MAG: hypothetical protein M1819_003998 [Sarea resinae]|nr:MAG: hypothetical protein M1819_003998 [Sarea resinae]
MATSTANTSREGNMGRDLGGRADTGTPLDQTPNTSRPLDDPFLSTHSSSNHPHRFSSFDTQLFAVNAATSPSQAKRALEAHLAETERRIQDASKLGTTLVEQRRELSERLKDVERQQGEAEIGPDLRQRLVEIEKEYNEVGRESARAFLGPKSRVASADATSSSPFAVDGRQPSTPSTFSSQANHSPSKLNVPSRKQRNQPSSRVKDIEFATEISTSLLSQVRNLQAILAERDEALKAVNLEKSRLEVEAEGLMQRLRSLDESEQRYKDENWNLETQTHELIAAAKVAADREQRLTQNLTSANAEKTTVQKELDELKQANARLAEDHALSRKLLESEAAGLRRNLTMGESERGALQRKVEELNHQNEELARAMAGRYRQEEAAPARDIISDDEDFGADQTTPEHSPPASPTKGTPRHNMLESETLKSSLHHAHRMIQNLKSNIHREKTEKIELRRMLQEARDELELRRNDVSLGGPSSAGKRRKVVPHQDTFKKPSRPNLLGLGRNSKSEILMDEAGWEDHDGQHSPSRSAASRLGVSSGTESRPVTDQSDAFETANEASDAFETANEREGTATETDAFETGAESFAPESSDDLTETEGRPVKGGTLRARRTSPLSLAKPGDQLSYMSTASTSTDEDDDYEIKTPVQQHQRLRLKINRGAAYRRSRVGSEGTLFGSNPTSARNSPASLLSNGSQGAPAGQSLFAELGELNTPDSEEGTEYEGTPSRASSQRSTPARGTSVPPPTAADLEILPSLRAQMTDASTMTDAPAPEPLPVLTAPEAAASTEARALTVGEAKVGEETPSAPEPLFEYQDAGVQYTGSKDVHEYHDAGVQHVEPPAPPQEVHEYLDAGVQHVEPPASPQEVRKYLDAGVQHIEPPTPAQEVHEYLDAGVQHESSVDKTEIPAIEAPIPLAPLALSYIQAQHTEPIAPAEPEPEAPVIEAPIPPAPLTLSYIQALHTEPISPVEPEPEIPAIEAPITPALLALSYVQAQQTEPISPVEPVPVPEPAITQAPAAPAPFALSHIQAQHTEPIAPVEPESEPEPIVETEPEPEPEVVHLQLSNITSQHTAPERVEVPELPAVEEVLTPLTFSSVQTQETEPIAPPPPEEQTRDVAVQETPLPIPEETKAPKMEDARPGFLGSMFGWNKPPAQHHIAEDDTSSEPFPQFGSETDEAKMPLKDMSSNIALRESANKENPVIIKPEPIPMVDQSSQTMLSATQIDMLLKDRNKRTSTVVEEDSQSTGSGSPGRQRSSSVIRHRKSDNSVKVRIADGEITIDEPPPRSPRRPGSANSVRSVVSATHPPLPPDHKQAIAAAAQRVSTPDAHAGQMGPPLAPASAYKSHPHLRPRTPNNQNSQSPGSRAGTTPRPRFSTGRSDVSSPVTRRSSVSSFASELDERFNIATPGMPGIPQGPAEGGTDPRMIQAITQTMIGEYLWKYTRKAGRGEMSDNRHRRYFWVHPYTRTLYWSDRDPSSAGKAELRAKSVAIEAVRVMTDDNPMPPGLHRKSLVILTPGRAVKFTATTGQRHETWFNALSYLLLRTGEESAASVEDSADPSQTITAEDVEEFNPSSYRTRTGGATSRSSYNSHNTRNTSPNRNSSRLSNRRPPTSTPSARAAAAAAERAELAPPQTVIKQPQGSMQGSISRLSNMFRPGSSLRGSFSSRRSRHSAMGVDRVESNIYDPTSGGIVQDVDHDSAEDLRLVIEQQEKEADRLENVRACCDGKHDVGSLAGRKGRLSSSLTGRHGDDAHHHH